MPRRAGRAPRSAPRRATGATPRHGCHATPRVPRCVTLPPRRRQFQFQGVNHTNLIELYSVCDDAGAVDVKGKSLGFCLCLEFCERGSLKDVLAETLATGTGSSTLPWKLRVEIAHGMVKGMCVLYGLSPPVEHRDLKSANVLLDAGWTAKIRYVRYII